MNNFAASFLTVDACANTACNYDDWCDYSTALFYLSTAETSYSDEALYLCNSKNLTL